MNVEVWGLVSGAFLDGNLEEFTRLLRAHPECLRLDNGMDYWMKSAAQNGQLPFIQALVDLGMDVNNPNYPDDPEGPIVQAADFGHYEVVRWLLDHGAKINFVVNGKPRCIPLVSAATQGHLDVAKLLVEHGAEIHATWNSINAISQAEDFGKWTVFDYLHSLGAGLCARPPLLTIRAAASDSSRTCGTATVHSASGSWKFPAIRRSRFVSSR